MKSPTTPSGAHANHSEQLSEHVPVVHSHHPEDERFVIVSGLPLTRSVRHTRALERTESSRPDACVTFSNLFSNQKRDSPPAERNHCSAVSVTVGLPALPPCVFGPSI